MLRSPAACSLSIQQGLERVPVVIYTACSQPLCRVYRAVHVYNRFTYSGLYDIIVLTVTYKGLI